MFRLSPLRMMLPLLTILLFAPPSSDAFEQGIDFETGDTSQLSYVYEPQNVSIVQSTLTNGGSYAFRCMIPQGASQYYCGFNINVDNLPNVSDLYVRYYVKFEPSWRFATDNRYFKSLVFEVDAVDYNAGGRTFINFNGEDQNTANIDLLIYTIDQWHPTGATISNDNRWHSVEIRSQRNLTSPANGRVQFWFDGQLLLDMSPFNAGNANPMYLTLGYRNGTAQQDMYMQYDEIVIADHPIGPIGAPSPPRNIRVQ